MVLNNIYKLAIKDKLNFQYLANILTIIKGILLYTWQQKEEQLTLLSY